MKSIDDLIAQKMEYKGQLEREIDKVQKEQVMLQQRHQALINSYHQADGAINALLEAKNELVKEAPPEGAPKKPALEIAKN